MAVALVGRRFGVWLKHRFLQQVRTGYIVLLPEVNPEVPDQNPLFKGGVPNIEKLNHEKCVTTLGRYILDFEHCVREVEDELLVSKNEAEKKDIFETVVEPLETLGAPLDTTWGLVKTMYLVDEKIMPRENYLSLHDRARRARSMKYNSHHIYKAFKDCDVSKLTEEEQRIVSKFIIEGKLNGLDLEGDQKIIYSDISRKLVLERDLFRRRAEVGRKQFRHIIIDSDVVQHFPKKLLDEMLDKTSLRDKGKGPWIVSHSPKVFPMFMEHCPDRDLRWNCWLASRQICSAYSPADLQNSSTLELIRSLRHDQAKLLGYKNYAEMSMETKIAGSVKNVQVLLSALLDKAKALQKKEINELQKFAESKGFEYELMLWDIPYWQREQKKALFNWDESKVEEYFPLDKVLEGLMELCDQLFSIRFQEATDMPTWHPNVKFYNIFEGDAKKPVAGLYFDPIAREGKLSVMDNGYMVGIRPGTRAYGPLTPLAALVFNFAPPTEDRPCLLSFSDVEALFKRFGNALQHLMSTVNYSEVSGMSNIEWDAVDVVSNIMSLWLNDPNVIKRISKHYQTGEAFPITNVEEVRRHMIGYSLSSELYLSSLDLKLHTSSDFWLSLVKEEWSKHFVLPLEKNDSHLCSFVPSVSGDLSAAYFTRIWSRTLATDAFTSFVSNQDLNSIGMRFRDTFLAFGGSCHPSEVFRRFQGRDPTPEAFIESLEKDKCVPDSK